METSHGRYTQIPSDEPREKPSAGDPPDSRGVPLVGWLVRPLSPIAIVGGLVVGLLLIVLWLAYVRHSQPRYAVCLSNVRNVALAFQMYLADNDDAFPATASWRPLLEGYLKNDDVLVCPEAEDGRGYYAYNSALSGRTLNDLERPEGVVIAFETDAARMLSGGPELLPEEPRHLGGDSYGFADGHASWSRRESVQTEDQAEPVWQKRPVGDMVWETAGNAD